MLAGNYFLLHIKYHCPEIVFYSQERICKEELIIEMGQLYILLQRKSVYRCGLQETVVRWSKGGPNITPARPCNLASPTWLCCKRRHVSNLRSYPPNPIKSEQHTTPVSLLMLHPSIDRNNANSSYTLLIYIFCYARVNIMTIANVR